MKNSSTITIALIGLALCLGAAAAWAAGLTVPSGSSIKLNTATMVVPGDITNAGAIEATTGIIKLTGNWANSGTFTAGTGTVEFTGTSGTVQTISGKSTFYNFLSTSGGLTLSFEAFRTASSTQEITGIFKLAGQLGSLIKIRSMANGYQAHIKPSGTWEVSYVDVKDSRNTTAIVINPANSVDNGNNTNWFFVDITPPTTPEGLAAQALPSAGPTYVQLTWEASTDEMGGSGLAGYSVYRSTSPEGTYIKTMSLITTISTNDVTVSLGTDYYYKITAQDNSSNESGYSNRASAPYLTLTREATITAPKSGGYSGSAADAVPGSTIKYAIKYSNFGFAVASSVEVVDRVPQHTEFKIGSATGEAVSQVKYSNDNGNTYAYTPSGTYVDANVTNVKWLCSNTSSGSTKEVDFSVVIR